MFTSQLLRGTRSPAWCYTVDAVVESCTIVLVVRLFFAAACRFEQSNEIVPLLTSPE